MSKVGEACADAAWAEHGKDAREFVALGFMLVSGRDIAPELNLSSEAAALEAVGIDPVVWYALPNTAGVGEFRIDGQDLMDVMQQAIVDLGSDVVQRCDRVLWHSHYIAVEPSDADVQEFPNWLVNMGMVYHAPTKTTTPYSGKHSSTKSPTSNPLATVSP